MLTQITITRDKVLSTLKARHAEAVKEEARLKAQYEQRAAKAREAVVAEAKRFATDPSDKNYKRLQVAFNEEGKLYRYDRGYGSGHEARTILKAIELVELSDQPTFKVSSRTELGRVLGL